MSPLEGEKFVEHDLAAPEVDHFGLRPLHKRVAIPAIYEQREFALAGGLASYGTSLTDAYRQLGIFTGRVLGRR